jgi:hypothetical protein
MKQLQETQITMIILKLLQNPTNKATLERSPHNQMNLIMVTKKDTPVEESRASITKILELRKLTRMMVPSL